MGFRPLADTRTDPFPRLLSRLFESLAFELPSVLILFLFPADSLLPLALNLVPFVFLTALLGLGFSCVQGSVLSLEWPPL